MTDFRFPHRVSGLRAALAATAEADGALVTNLENVRYLTGFTGSNGLVLVTASAAVFVTDGRYTIQAEREVPGFERVILPQGTNMAAAAGEQIGRIGGQKWAFEEAHLTVKQHAALVEKMPEGVALVGKSDLVEGLRQIKDADEVAAVRAAIEIADACFEALRTTIVRPGRTEREIAWDIESFMRGQGAQRLSFESIVAGGPHGALPHARPSDRKVGVDGPEFLVLDFGCELDGYCSDITRTFVVGGEPTARHRAVYDAVLKSQLASLAAIQPGAAGKDIHQIAQDSLTASGLGEYFTHGLGHGLGRVVHDGPAFSRTSKAVLAPGMIVTVEPGAYLQDWGGVRIEDDVLVTADGHEILTQSTKELIAIGA